MTVYRPPLTQNGFSLACTIILIIFKWIGFQHIKIWEILYKIHVKCTLLYKIHFFWKLGSVGNSIWQSSKILSGLSYHHYPLLFYTKGFPGGSDGKESACNAGDLGSIPGSGRPPGGGHGNPLQYACLENPMDRGALRVPVHAVAKSWTRLSSTAQHSTFYTKAHRSFTPGLESFGGPVLF